MADALKPAKGSPKTQATKPRVGGLSRFARVLLNGTALAPAGLTYGWVAFMQGQLTSAGIIAGISLLFVFLCLLLLASAKQSVASSAFTATSIETVDHENIGFLLLYTMPLFTSQFSTLHWHFWIPTLLVVAVIAATGFGFHVNPLLGVLGWHFYKVQTAEGVTYVLITRAHLRKMPATLNVGRLTEYILLDYGGA